ncbi:MAG: hypothetical protein V4488_05605 [Pseudomonadota bacterium]
MERIAQELICSISETSGRLYRDKCRLGVTPYITQSKQLEADRLQARQPITLQILQGTFNQARIAAAIKYPKLAEDIKKFQFRDLRAKVGTNKKNQAV